MIEELLAPDGSVWVHLDDAEMAYAKVMLDEIFGRNSFVATIVGKSATPGRTVLRSARFRTTSSFTRQKAGTGATFETAFDAPPRRSTATRTTTRAVRGVLIPITAQGFRANQMYTITAPNGKEHRPPKGRCWSMVEEKYLELLAAGKIGFGADGNAQPGLLRYLDEDEGLVPWTWWTYDEVGHTDEVEERDSRALPGRGESIRYAQARAADGTHHRDRDQPRRDCNRCLRRLRHDGGGCAQARPTLGHCRARHSCSKQVHAPHD